MDLPDFTDGAVYSIQTLDSPEPGSISSAPAWQFRVLRELTLARDSAVQGVAGHSGAWACAGERDSEREGLGTGAYQMVVVWSPTPTMRLRPSCRAR